MHPHTSRTPRPAAVPPAARGLPGSVSRALARLAATTTLPKAEQPRPLTPALTDALLNLRAADPTFDANPGLRALRKALAGRVRERLAGVEADVAILDMLGGDPDLEATGDDESSLCGVGTHEGSGPTGNTPYDGGRDLEYDDADGPEGDDDREPDVDDEPTLCGTTCNALFASGRAMASGENEPSLASLGGTAEGCDQDQAGWGRGDLADREVDTGSATHGREGLWREPGLALNEARDHARRLRHTDREGGALRLLSPGVGFIPRSASRRAY